MTKAKEVSELAASPLHKMRVEAEAKLRAKSAKDMSIAERLMLRTYDQRLTIPIRDANGTIKIEMRMWTRSEIATFDEALTYMDEESARGKLARENVFGFLGEMCVDESLTREYFENGEWGLATFMEIRAGIMDGVAKTVIDARTFRVK